MCSKSRARVGQERRRKDAARLFKRSRTRWGNTRSAVGEMVLVALDCAAGARDSPQIRSSRL